MLALRDDQVASLAFYIGQKKCLDLSDPGTGKTPPVCVNQFRRREEGIRTVWVMPKSLMAKNKEEILRFTPFTSEDVAIIDDKKSLLQLQGGASVFIMGPDRFKRSVDDLRSDVRALDVDEHHMCFGGHTSGRTNAFYKLCHRVDEMVMMTGTLVNGRLDTCYPAIHAIEPGYYPLGFEQFMGVHAPMLDDFGRPLYWDGHDRIAAILQKHGIRKTFEQVFGKQEIVFDVEWVQMNPKQREIHDKFRDEAYLELERFFIDGTLPGVATTRCRQIMDHPNDFPDLSDQTGRSRVNILGTEKPAKLDAMEVHFENHNRRGTPILIFAFWVPQQEQIATLAERMGRKPVLINGETSVKDRDAADRAFRAGLADTMICSPACAAVGYNWQELGGHELDHVVWSSLSYMDVEFIQGFRRAVRKKRGKPLRVTTQAYYDSLDIAVMSIVQRKNREARKIEPTRQEIVFSSHEEKQAA